MDIAFTKEALDNLKPKSKRYYIKDRKTSYLSLVVYESGSKTFIINRRINGQMQKIKIGRYDCLTIEQARKKAKTINAEIEMGANPKQEKLEAKKALTFLQLYELYYEQYAVPFTKRPEDNKAILDNHVFPSYGSTKANSISPHDMRALHSAIGNKKSVYSKPGETKKSLSTANRVIAIVSAVFNFGIKNGLLSGSNPCSSFQKYKTVSRDRFITFDEMSKFMDALKAEPKLFSDFFKICLYTGARKTNVLSMKYEDLHYDIKQWRIAENQTKNKEVNIVSLSESALKILQSRDMFNEFSKSPSKFVFPGEGEAGHLKDPKRSFGRIKKHMGIPDIRIHDLRRTLGSYMAINGASLPMIGKALNHKSHASTAIYARLSHDPILQAVNAVTSYIPKVDNWTY
jgi:integrase